MRWMQICLQIVWKQEQRSDDQVVRWADKLCERLYFWANRPRDPISSFNVICGYIISRVRVHGVQTGREDVKTLPQFSIALSLAP